MELLPFWSWNDVKACSAHDAVSNLRIPPSSPKLKTVKLPVTKTLWPFSTKSKTCFCSVWNCPRISASSTAGSTASFLGPLTHQGFLWDFGCLWYPLPLALAAVLWHRCGRRHAFERLEEKAAVARRNMASWQQLGEKTFRLSRKHAVISYFVVAGVMTHFETLKFHIQTIKHLNKRTKWTQKKSRPHCCQICPWNVAVATWSSVLELSLCWADRAKRRVNGLSSRV